MKFIDLTHPINEDMPIFPGDPKTKIESASDLEKDGFRQHLVSVCTHTGTHIDAPYHMIEKGKNLDQIPIDRLIGQGVYIRIGKAFNLKEIKKVNIEEGDIVLFHTGRADHYHELEYFEDYPEITEDIANYLVEKGVKMVGLDICSADTHESFPIHKILLKNDILIIENLTNLDQLEGKEFNIYALPMRLQVDGAPARVIAEIV